MEEENASYRKQNNSLVQQLKDLTKEGDLEEELQIDIKNTREIKEYELSAEDMMNRLEASKMDVESFMK